LCTIIDAKASKINPEKSLVSQKIGKFDDILLKCKKQCYILLVSERRLETQESKWN